jgi:hypothetical protein
VLLIHVDNVAHNKIRCLIIIVKYIIDDFPKCGRKGTIFTYSGVPIDCCVISTLDPENVTINRYKRIKISMENYMFCVLYFAK